MRAALLALGLLLICAAPAGAAPRLVSMGSFDRPVYVTSPPNDQRIFVVEKGGTIRLVGGGTFLNIASLVNGSDEERGLLSMAFSPNYASNGLFYVDYTNTEGDIEVVEYKRSAANPNVADPRSRRPVFFAEHTDNQFHNGGQLQFGPDGKLYVSVGDAQHGENAQDLSVPYGKILQLNLAGGYSVWSYGLRNPWRFSFDRATGDIAIGDVGETSWEEIDWSASPTRGRNVNFGWPTSEGFGSFGQNPILAHDHSSFCAIVGGYVVHDAGLPTLNGRYIYGDNCDDRIWYAMPRTGAGNKPTGLHVPGLSSFGQDACGHVYAASLLGPVYRFRDGALTCSLGGGKTADTTPPRVKVSILGARKALKKRRLRVAVRSNERCAATIGTRLSKVRRLATRHRNLLADHRKVVTLKLSKSTLKKLRKRLEHHSFVRVNVTVRATDAAGNTKKVTRHGRIKRR
jgi:Glucose / Sorbosone dehydrogenase